MNEFFDTFGPTIAALAPSFIGGFVLGLLAKKALRTTMLIAGIALLLVYLAGRVGLDAGAVEAWIRSASSWAGDNIEGAQRSLAALLPSAGAAAAGGVLGFRGRRKPLRSK